MGEEEKSEKRLKEKDLKVRVLFIQTNFQAYLLNLTPHTIINTNKPKKSYSLRNKAVAITPALTVHPLAIKLPVGFRSFFM